MKRITASSLGLGMIFLLSACISACQSGIADGLYGPVEARKYLTGQFDPERHPDFVELKSLGIRTDGRKHYLRKDAALSLKKMMDAFRGKHPRIRFWVQSSTRNFSRQKAIWEEKWNGRRPVSGKTLDANMSPLKKALLILRYSSMPGTSRHHWGTDFDINELSNSYYKKGDGGVLYDWLRANAGTFGFCQPYTEGRKEGYEEERWHWSYHPLSGAFLSDWNALFGAGTAELARTVKFEGSAAALRLAGKYVNAVNSNCK